MSDKTEKIIDGLQKPIWKQGCENCQCLESQLREANAKAERYKEALEGIERWCISIKKTYQPSIFAKGCITPTGETILAENLENLAKTALEEGGKGK